MVGKKFYFSERDGDLLGLKGVAKIIIDGKLMYISYGIQLTVNRIPLDVIGNTKTMSTSNTHTAESACPPCCSSFAWAALPRSPRWLRLKKTQLRF